LGLRKNSKQPTSVDGVLFTALYKTASPQSAETPGLLLWIGTAAQRSWTPRLRAGASCCCTRGKRRRGASRAAARPWRCGRGRRWLEGEGVGQQGAEEVGSHGRNSSSLFAAAADSRGRTKTRLLLLLGAGHGGNGAESVGHGTAHCACVREAVEGKKCCPCCQA
jgi:hypothetical protein